jgi:ABC-type long-subunit fatty acid transport system fused permease/ATPase subunit
MCTQINIYLSIFPIRIFIRDVEDMIYAKSIFPNLSHWVIENFHSISKMKIIIFPTEFLNDYIRVHFSYYSHKFFERVLTSKIHKFKCTKGEYYKVLCPFERTHFHKDTPLTRQTNIIIHYL